MSEVSPHQQTLNDDLLYAVFNNDEQEARRLILQGANVNAESLDGVSLIDIAMAQGNLGIVRAVLETPQPKGLRQKNEEEALILSARYGHKDLMMSLIKKGVDVNAENTDNETALFEAIRSKNQEIIDILIKHGARVNATNVMEDTPLTTAVRLHPEIVDTLLDLGANINERNSDGITPVLEAVRGNDINLVKRMVDRGANILVQDEAGSNALHYVAEDNLEMAQFLLGKGVNINAQGDFGETPLMRALISKQPKLARLLVEKDADVSLVDNRLRTPLHVASADDVTMMRLLIEHGADVNARDNKGNTPLFYVPYKGAQEYVDVLIKHGADINAKNYQGNSVLHHLIAKGDFETAMYLIEKGADVTAVNVKGKTVFDVYRERTDRDSIEGKQLEAMLVDKGAKLSTHPDNVDEALSHAIMNKNVAQVKYWVENGADVNKNDYGRNPLDVLYFDMESASKENRAVYEKMEKILLDNGAKTAEPMSDKFASAVIRNDVKAMELYASKGVDLSHKYAGFKPIEWAVLLGNKEAVESLLSKGVNVNEMVLYGTLLDDVRHRMTKAETKEEIAKYKAIETLLLNQGAKTIEELAASPLEMAHNALQQAREKRSAAAKAGQMPSVGRTLAGAQTDSSAKGVNKTLKTAEKGKKTIPTKTGVASR